VSDPQDQALPALSFESIARPILHCSSLPWSIPRSLRKVGAQMCG